MTGGSKAKPSKRPHAAASSKSSSSIVKSTTTSIVEKLSMLRGFVSSDVFSETDLSTCLRQAGYNVELAAERLMTGQFQPCSKRPRIESSTSSTTTKITTPKAATAMSLQSVPSSTKIRKPTPVTPKTPSPSSAVAISSTHQPTTPATASSLNVKPTVVVPPPETVVNQSIDESASKSSSIDDSWLLCHRWISDGICLQRNASVAYQEVLQVDHTSNASPKAANAQTVRFRAKRMVGQFPKHLCPLLGPLLEAQLIQVQAQALMEERFLPMGADIAIAVWIYLPDPLKFLALLDPSSSDTTAQASNRLFFGKAKQTSKSNKRSMLQQAAFALLQWAHQGETFDFETPKSSSSEEEESGDELVDDGETYDPADAETKEEFSAALAPDSKTKLTALLQEMEPPTDGSFRATLRPYQKQALWWMTQREAQDELEESSRQQLELLEELVAPSSTSSSSSSLNNSSNSNASPIHCECGPVMVDTSRMASPAVTDVLVPSGTTTNPDLKHPLWERRFLCNASQTQAMSFYVQPLFGAAVATPPPPPRPCRGGILADSMGLGKTVMLLALILQSSKDDAANGSTSKDEPSTTTTTLIVCPLSLLAQWQEEIESKTSLSYHVYYGDSKKQGATFDWDSVDIVLTTYGSLQSDWMAHAKAAAAKEDGGLPVKRKGNTGLLTHAWKRVILDEAHCVKNTATVASRACCLLQAERRWCVSGTIIQNSLDDVYALLKFLKHEPWCQPSFWKAAISSKLRSTTEDSLEQKQQAVDRVRRLLVPIMLRRTKDSVDKDGNPILTLPPVENKIIRVEFSPAERQFYDALHRKSLSLFEGFIQDGTASKSWLAIFSLLHRLRQTCDHVALTVKSHIDEDEWASNISQFATKAEEEKSKTRATTPVVANGNKDAIDKKFLDDLMNKFRAMQRSGSKGNKELSPGDDPEDAPYAAKIAQMLNEAVQNKSSLLAEECSICLDPINVHDSVVTPCFHIFCKDCLVGVLRQQGSSQNSESNNNSNPLTILRVPNGPCPVCKDQIDASRILRLSESSDGHIHTSYLLSSMITPTTVAVREEDGAARQALETAVQGSTSSKLTAILQELDNVWTKDPGSKVLIFSQFLGFLDLMEQSFKSNQIPFSRLDGKLNLKERMAILQEFGSDKGEKQRIETSSSRKNVGSVLLISMKAGGVGLNLVSARTVFIADRWWNASVEDQCVDRIHRIGQTADKVRVRKFYVANSVEERIVELQKRKKNVAIQALCDEEQEDTDGQNGSRPTLEDFKILFQE